MNAEQAQTIIDQLQSIQKTINTTCHMLIVAVVVLGAIWGKLP